MYWSLIYRNKELFNQTCHRCYKHIITRVLPQENINTQPLTNLLLLCYFDLYKTRAYSALCNTTFGEVFFFLSANLYTLRLENTTHSFRQQVTQNTHTPCLRLFRYAKILFSTRWTLLAFSSQDKKCEKGQRKEVFIQRLCSDDYMKPLLCYDNQRV